MTEPFAMIPRRVMEMLSPIPNTLAVFIVILSHARLSDFTNAKYGYVVPRGATDLTQEQIGAACKLKRQAVRTALGHLSTTGLIEIQPLGNHGSNHNRVATKLVNHWLYIGGTPNINQEVTTAATKDQPREQPRGNQGVTTLDKQESRKRKLETISPDGFDEWYGAYPRKVGKPAALKSWGKLTSEQRDTAAKAVHQFSSAMRDYEQQYIPHPSTYLNQHRFNDPIPSKQSFSSNQKRGGVSFIQDVD